MRTHFNVASPYSEILVHLMFEIRTEAGNPDLEDMGRHFLLRRGEGKNN